MAGICGDALIGKQCCFKGTLSRIELRGEGVAFFSDAEALAVEAYLHLGRRKDKM